MSCVPTAPKLIVPPKKVHMLSEVDSSLNRGVKDPFLTQWEKDNIIQLLEPAG